MSLEFEEIAPLRAPTGPEPARERPTLVGSRHPFSKVPEITTVFWAIKILTTATGETTSDFLDHRFGPAVAVAVGMLGFAGGLYLQVRATRYVPWIYWLTVSMVAIFGTMAADGVHVIGVPYVASTSFYAVVLAAIFIGWYRQEGTLSIHSIHTFQRERFYWATVLATFALGTAAGDMTASSLDLGFLTSGLLFAALFALPALVYWLTSASPILVFWFAYVITRPLGASFSDWFASSKHGLGWGTGRVSLVLGVLIVVLVSYLAITHDDVEEEHHHDHGRELVA